MLSLISNIRLNRIKEDRLVGFKKEINNYTTSELVGQTDDGLNNFTSEVWLALYR
ncbi:hypothetical protein OA848_00810 [Rickettsiales bacterium]|nr:hypothetical protein [Rickettsiales bacterium]